LSKLDAYISKFYTDTSRQQINMGLDRIRVVKKLAKINPNFLIITVGGTNGKGSVCSFLETIYTNAGYSVGCYTSPHLFKFNERIKINLEQVDDKSILKSLDFIQKNKQSTDLTYFEITTLAAINIFIKKNIDIAILEVGLGGRLDAVNIFEPEISIITSVGMDHQDFLGDSIEEIAYEKSGICRPNKHAILNFENIPKSMIKNLNNLGASLSIINHDYSISVDSKGYNYRSRDKVIDGLPQPFLKGDNQLNNLAGALRALSLLDKKLPVSLSALKKGIRGTRIKGRIEILSKQPFIVADVAHNADAAINLYNFISKSKRGGKLYAIFSILANKDIMQVLLPFIGIVDEWFISEINDPRTQKIEVIASSLEKHKKQVAIRKFDNLRHAYNDAFEKCGLNDNIIIYGSFHTVTETTMELKQ
jgi:dihydrofolate synthase/folylpolyglutamate synthase